MSPFILTLVLCGRNVLILRSIQQGGLCISCCLSVRWGLSYFCSSYFAPLFPALKNLSELAKGCGTWEWGGEEERRWVKYFPDDGWHHNPKLHPNPPGSSFLSDFCLSLFLGTNSPFSVYFPSVSRCSPALYCIDASPFVIPATFWLHTLITFPCRLNGSEPNKIMPQEPHEATDLQLILRQIVLDLKTSKSCQYLAKWLWANSAF